MYEKREHSHRVLDRISRIIQQTHYQVSISDLVAMAGLSIKEKDEPNLVQTELAF